MSIATRLITAGLKSGKFGSQPNSTAISTSLTSDKRLSSNGSPQIKKAANTRVTSPMASPAELLSRPTLNACLPPTVATGVSKTAATTLIVDWNYDEGRSRIRKGHGPENITRLRRFAISMIKSKGVRSVPQKMRQLMRNVRLVFDYL